jgi:hypothetical protein
MSSFDVIDFLSKYQDPTITFTVQKPGKGEGNTLLQFTLSIHIYCNHLIISSVNSSYSIVHVPLHHGCMLIMRI